MSIQPKDTSKGHFYVSLVKSALRVIAGGALVMTSIDPFNFDNLIVIAGGFLIAAEILGIVEELV